MAMLSPKQCHWPFAQKNSTPIDITRRIRKSSCTIVSSLLHFFLTGALVTMVKYDATSLWGGVGPLRWYIVRATYDRLAVLNRED